MLVKYSFRIAGRVATASMEREFWDALRDIAADHDTTLSALLAEIIAKTGSDPNRRRLSSVLRVYILEQYIPEKGVTMHSSYGSRRRGASSGKGQKKRMPP
ncbi:MAG: ribbon-helix-helix domain-containing protein [Xanthobacteraceae bacterium]